MLNISYVKNRNSDVLKELELEEYTNIKNVQRYIPIYNRFFELNNTNYNNIIVYIIISYASESFIM